MSEKNEFFEIVRKAQAIKETEKQLIVKIQFDEESSVEIELLSESSCSQSLKNQKCDCCQEKAVYISTYKNSIPEDEDTMFLCKRCNADNFSALLASAFDGSLL
jgi:hypothetical protein